MTLARISCHCGKKETVGHSGGLTNSAWVDEPKSGVWDCPKCGCIWKWHDTGDDVEVKKIKNCDEE